MGLILILLYPVAALFLIFGPALFAGHILVGILMLAVPLGAILGFIVLAFVVAALTEFFS